MAKKIITLNTLFGEAEQIVNTKDVPSIDEQWKIFQQSDTFKNIEHIDTIELKNELITDLKTKSAMDVREYTLYQKWCEVKEKYPLVKNTLINEPTLLNSKHDRDIFNIKELRIN